MNRVLPRAIRLASKQFDELLNGKAGSGNNAAKGTGTDLFVIRNDYPYIRLVATEHQRAKFCLCCHDLDELLACLGRHWITGISAILDVKLNSFPDIVQRFRAGVALGDTPGQRWHGGNIPAIRFLLQNDRVTH
jgi:hypothetical protein